MGTAEHFLVPMLCVGTRETTGYTTFPLRGSFHVNPRWALLFGANQSDPARKIPAPNTITNIKAAAENHNSHVCISLLFSQKTLTEYPRPCILHHWRFI